MEQITIVKLLANILCCAVMTGSNSNAETGASTQNQVVSGKEQPGGTTQPVFTTTHSRSSTGRPISTSNSPFVCADGSGSINRGLLCNGRIDCVDSSDENSQLCNGTSCNDTFPCHNGKCIEFSSVCNGSDECGDDSDETFSLCWSSASRIHTCGNGQVLVGTNMTCTGVYNCLDKSDEFNCSRCPGQLMCDKGYRCVKPEAFCDRIQDCFDGADESCLIPDNQKCNVGDFICPTGMCVTKENIMSGNRCWGPHVLTREENLKYCKLPNVLCDNATKCIPSEYRCDGKLDCQDGSDEMSPNKNNMTDPSLKCANGFCVPYLAMCNGINDCGDSSDEYPSNTQCLTFSAVNCSSVDILSSNYWQCNNSLCIPFYQVDNGINNCGDFSDEKNSSGFYFTCTNGEKLLRSFLCDGRDNCGDNSDEVDLSCTVNTPRPTCPQHTCPSGRCISYSDLCDGYNDCGDRSDEQRCSLTTRRPICYGHTCPSGKCILLTDVCDGYNDCGDHSDEQRCSFTTRRSICSGHTCPSGKCIRLTDLCDGFNDCGDHSDESGCVNSPCFGHKCPSGKCILYSEVCDGSDDCEDGSDESYCTWTYTHTRVAVGVCVPGGVIVFVGGCFGAKRRRTQTTTRTTRAQAANTAVITSITTTTPVASDLPPSYAQVVGTSSTSQAFTNKAFGSSASVSI